MAEWCSALAEWMRCMCVSVCWEDHQGLRILSDYLLYCQREHGRHRRSWKCLDNLSAKVAIKANNRPCRSLPQSCRTSLFTIPQVNTHQHNNEHSHIYTDTHTASHVFPYLQFYSKDALVRLKCFVNCRIFVCLSVIVNETSVLW